MLGEMLNVKTEEEAGIHVFRKKSMKTTFVYLPQKGGYVHCGLRWSSSVVYGKPCIN